MARTLIIALAFSTIVQALPSWSNAEVKQGATDVAKEYDYIVVGAGTAGTTVADRLSENGKQTVLVVEYGRLAQDDSFMPLYNTPAPEFLYNLTSVPQTNVNNRTFPVANGAVVGGGSAVNGQFFDRGSAEDYNNWAKFPGNSGWDWEGLYPYFKKSSALTPPTSAMKEWGITYDAAAYSDNGSVVAAYPDYQYATQKIHWKAWIETGSVPIQKEHANGHAYGLFWIPTSMDPARGYNRSFAVLSHYIKVQPRKNYHLLTLHRVTKVNLADKDKDKMKHAVSVEIRDRLFKKTNGGPYTAWITSSGAFLPPRTFVGDSFDAMVKEIAKQKPQDFLPSDTPEELIAGYQKQKEIQLGSFKSKTNAWLEHPISGKGWGMCILLKPFSRGYVKINPVDPLGDAIFDYRLWSNPIDKKMHVRMQTYIRKHFLESTAYKDLGIVEQDPVPGAVVDDAGWEDWLLNQNKLMASNGHSVGTAAMMPRELGGVVDNQLRVYGTRGLSIADTSIIPLIPGTHTQTTAYAIGEKAADLIKARHL
ncbi:hypothetical protein ACEQ8H_000821 [Pleosporales sp. CAS-2024a]